MSHFAELDATNTVLRVVVADEGDAGLDWLTGNLGGRWIQTSITKRYRVRYAEVGMFYDEQRDAFYWPKPDDGNPEWFFNEETVQWELPKVSGA